MVGRSFPFIFEMVPFQGDIRSFSVEVGVQQNTWGYVGLSADFFNLTEGKPT